MRLVRENPALSAWFAPDGSPMGAEIAERSDVVQVLTAGFLSSLQPEDAAVIERRARWLVRVLSSLLIFPGHDEADEQALLEEFVVPMMFLAEHRT